MQLQKNDFVEIEFTGKLKDTGQIFDSNIKEDVEKMHEGHDHSKENHNLNVKPFVFALGHGMFLKGVDDFLVGKSENFENFELEINPENAFGLRDSKLVQLMPLNVFIKNRLNPYPGAVFNFDGRMGKVLSVNGGRVMIDFNHPVAGKVVLYKIKLLRKVEDQKEKVNAINNFLFGREFESEISGKTLKLKVDEKMTKFVELFKDKFKEIFDLDLEVIN